MGDHWASGFFWGGGVHQGFLGRVCCRKEIRKNLAFFDEVSATAPNTDCSSFLLLTRWAQRRNARCNAAWIWLVRCCRVVRRVFPGAHFTVPQGKMFLGEAGFREGRGSEQPPSSTGLGTSAMGYTWSTFQIISRIQVLQ